MRFLGAAGILQAQSKLSSKLLLLLSLRKASAKDYGGKYRRARKSTPRTKDGHPFWEEVFTAAADS